MNNSLEFLCLSSSAIQTELDIFEKMYEELLNDSDIQNLNEIIQYAKTLQGKRVRPKLVFLFARLNGCVNQSTYWFALGLELIHLASLCHDDVIDKSNLRRSKATVRKLWGNRSAILFGDYLIMLAFHAFSQAQHCKKTNHIFEIFKEISTNMIKGEFLQIENSRLRETSIEKYYELIFFKTGCLIQNCCVLGYLSTALSDDEQLLNSIKKIGKAIGNAFQIQDDLLDYYNKPIGKPTLKDIRECKLTLPFLSAIHKSSAQEKDYYLNLLKSKTNLQEEECIETLLKFVTEKEGIAQTESVLNDIFFNIRQNIIYLPDVEIKIVLIHFLETLFKRKQ